MEMSTPIRPSPLLGRLSVNIPAVLTAFCAWFGGQFPVESHAIISGDEIGQENARSIGRSLVILVKDHGVFTIEIKNRKWP